MCTAEDQDSEESRCNNKVCVPTKNFLDQQMIFHTHPFESDLEPALAPLCNAECKKEHYI